MLHPFDGNKNLFYLFSARRRGFATRIAIPPPSLSDLRTGGPRWIRFHAVALTGLALIAGQIGWMVALLSHSFFRTDDFPLVDGALRHGFTWSYLMTPENGHLMPVGLAITWAAARISLYGWLLAASVVAVAAAAASLAMLRMLLTVFTRQGEQARAGILLPLAVYLFSPLLAGATAWWSVALRVLPFQAAMFMAVHSHVRYLRDGKRRHIAAAAGWLVLGMASADQGVLVPLLLFALTVAYFTPGRLREAAVRAAVAHWRAWAAYGALMCVYCAIFFAELSGAGAHVAGPGKATSLYEFAVTMLGMVVLPSVLGGPWQWAAPGYAQAAPPHVVEYLAWAVFVIVVLVSSLARPRAWRAWGILLGWVVVACVVPAAIEGFGLYATALGAETGFVANATGVFALCLGLAFLPAGDLTREAPRPVRVLAVLTFCCFVTGAVTSLQAFVSSIPSAAVRSYIATARVALADAPRGTVIVDGRTPSAVLDPAFFPAQARTSRVVADLAPGDRVRWTPVPFGAGAPMTFDASGALAPLTVTGAPSLSPPRRARGCWNVTSAETAIPIAGTLYRWSWIARLSYKGPGGWLFVGWDANSMAAIDVPAGSHVAYVPMTGDGNRVRVQFFPRVSGPLCVTGLTVGLVRPDPSARTIPATPVAG